MRQRLSVNLAARPRRNRRFFFLSIGLLGVVFAATAVRSIVVSSRYGRLNGETAAVVSGLMEKLHRFETANEETALVLQQNEQRYGATVRHLNGMIRRKGFSWTSFLSDLETLLPPACHIVSLAPVPQGERDIQVSLQVSAPSLNDLLLFLRRLQDRRYSPYMQSETKTSNGNLIAGVTFVYQGTD